MAQWSIHTANLPKLLLGSSTVFQMPPSCPLMPCRLAVSHGAVFHEGTLWKFRALESQALDMQ